MLLFLTFVLAIILSLAVCVYVLLQQAAGDAAGRSMKRQKQLAACRAEELKRICNKSSFL